MRLALFSTTLLIVSICNIGCKTPKAIGKQNITAHESLSIPHESYKLANGLSVILAQDRKNPFVAVSVWYDVGSVNEVPGKTGLAHLFEHLMFEGSRNVKAGEHFKILEAAGTYGLNASTSFTRTNYYETLPKSQLPLALALESDRMWFLDVSQAKLDEQRRVVRREREQTIETKPYGSAMMYAWQKLFPKPDVLNGRIIGSHEDIEAAKLEDVQNFYQQYYGPSNATLTLVGDFDLNEAKQLINKYFASLPRTSHPKRAASMPRKLFKEEVLNFDEKLGKTPFLSIMYLTPSLYKPGDAELDAISLILSNGGDGRLQNVLVRDKKLVNSISASQQSMSEVSVFSIDAMLNPGVEPKQVIKAIDDVLAGLLSSPPTKSEIERARNSLLTSHYFSLQNIGGPNGKAEILQSYKHFANDSNFLQKDLARYQALDQSHLIKAVKDYLPIEKDREILIATPSNNQQALKDKQS